MKVDWSEHISNFPRRIAQLVDAMNLHKYKTAINLATDMIADLAKVCAWIVNESLNKGRK